MIAIFLTLSAIIAEAGAPIPPLCNCPAYIVGEDRIAMRNSFVVMIYTAKKEYRNDRVFVSNMGG